MLSTTPQGCCCGEGVRQGRTPPRSILPACTRSLKLLGGFLVAALIFAAGVVESAPCAVSVTEMDVTSTADVETLVEALSCTGAGIFNVTWHGTVTVQQMVNVTGGSHLTVTQAQPDSSGSTGDGLDGGAVVEAGTSTGLFLVSGGSMLTLVDLELKGGNAYKGGAVWVVSESSLGLESNRLTAVGCTFTANTATVGGAIFSDNSTITIDGTSVLSGNSAEFAGAILSRDSVVNVEGTTAFTNNFVTDFGGAIVAFRSTVNIGGTTTFTSNTATYGGAIYSESASVVLDGNSTFTGNEAQMSGGAVSATRSELDLVGNSTFYDNDASAGGAVDLLESAMTTSASSTFSGNSASIFGAAILCKDSEMSIDGTTIFTNNSANVAAGAISSYSSVVTIDGEATFSGNTPGPGSGLHEGGAIDLTDSELSLVGNASFVDNIAGTVGGALSATRSNIAMAGVTMFSTNSARDSGGGAVQLTGSTLSIRGIASFAGNSALVNGGAIHARLGSEVILDGSTSFISNYAIFGGAIHCIDSNLTSDGISTFTANSGSTGGAISLRPGTFTLTGTSFFDENEATNKGGAINSEFQDVNIAGSASFTNNFAREGGAIHSSTQAIHIDGSASFNDNSARFGGAIFNELAELRIGGSATFENNTAVLLGGAIYHNMSVLGIDGTAGFTNNSANTGGAIYSLESSQLDIGGVSTFTGNVAVLQGGAIYSAAICEVKIGGVTTFTSNEASDQGGALYAVDSLAVNVSGSASFVGNAAQSGGGAMSLSSPETLNISGAAFASNVANFGGAIALISGVDQARTFEGCTFEENQASDGGALYFYTSAGLERIERSVFRGNYAEVSGGAVTYTGILKIRDTTFEANQAAKEGFAIMSLGVLEDGSLFNVVFDRNVPHCPATQYGYEEAVDNTNDTCRFELACARCATSCEDIPVGASVATEATIPLCVDLPEGAIAESTGTNLATLSIDEGYYRTSAESREVLECYQEDACVGGTAAQDNCASGYQGPYCAVCTDGYASGSSYSCHECSGAAGRSATWLAVLALIVAVAVLAALVSDLVHVVDDDGTRTVWGRRRENCRRFIAKAFPLTAIKTVVVVWQIVTQFAAIAGDVYPEQYEEFITYLNPINLDIGLILSYACIVTTGFYARLLLATIGPLVALAALSCTYFIARKRNDKSDGTVLSIQRKHISVALFAMFFIYSSVSFTVFQTFVCDKLDNGVTYLRADYRLTCTTAEHIAYKWYAGLMVLVYPVGIPAFFTWWLVRNRGYLTLDARDSMGHLTPWRSLWAAYRPGRFFFEVVEYGRRIALTGVAVFVLPDSAAQIAIVLLLAVVFLFIYESSSPFEDSLEMGLYRWGNGIVLASMYSALLLKVDVSNEDNQSLSAFVGVLIAAHVFMVVTVIVQSYQLIQEYRREIAQAP